MDDLISRKALMEFAHNHIGGRIDCNDIARFPAIEAEPVRRGEWIWHEDDWCYECSHCNTRFDYDKTYELFDKGFMYASYCANCGTKMDGGKK